MQELDFSGLNKIAYKGFENAEERDSLLEAGFTIVSPQDNPFEAPQSAPVAPPPSAPVILPENLREASERKREALTDHTGGRDYKKLYRIAHDFHQRHNPPEVVRDYWKDHRPGEDEPPEAEAQYWIKTAQDMGETASAGGGDSFLMALLSAIMDELEREYKAIRDKASGRA